MDTKKICTISPHFSSGISTTSREYGALFFRMLADKSIINSTKKIDYFVPLARGSFQFMGNMVDSAISNYHGVNNYGIIGSLAYSASYFLNCTNTWFAQYNYGTIQEVINENEFIIKFFNFKDLKKIKLNEEKIYKFDMDKNNNPNLKKNNNYNFTEIFSKIDEEFKNIIEKTKENIESIENTNNTSNQNNEIEKQKIEIEYKLLININSILLDNYSCYLQHITYKDKQNFLNKFDELKDKILNLFSESTKKLFISELNNDTLKNDINNYFDNLIIKYKDDYINFSENTENLISHLIKEYDLVGLIISYKDVLPQFGSGATFAMVTTGLCYSITDNLTCSLLSSVLQISINSIFDLTNLPITWSEFNKNTALSLTIPIITRYLSSFITDCILKYTISTAAPNLALQCGLASASSLSYIGTFMLVSYTVNKGYEKYMDNYYIEDLKKKAVENYNKAVRKFDNDNFNLTISNYLVNDNDDKIQIRKKYMNSIDSSS